MPGELKFNPLIWQVREKSGDEKGRTLIGCPSAVLSRLLRKRQGALERLREIWDLNEDSSAELIKQMWSSNLAPKLRSFLWLLLHKALPTWERRAEWLLELGVAACDKQCSSVPNSIPHVLVTCRRVAPIWCWIAEWLSFKLTKRIVLLPRFILIGVGETEMEKGLAKEGWWRTWRAWTLHHKYGQLGRQKLLDKSATRLRCTLPKGPGGRRCRRAEHVGKPKE